jgi:hypothetical protein
VNKYLVRDQQGDRHRLEAESLRRDGDWAEFQMMVPAMTKNRFPDPSAEGGFREVMVASGAKTPQAVALFYKPTSVMLLAPEANENDAA